MIDLVYFLLTKDGIQRTINEALAAIKIKIRLTSPVK